MRTLDEDARRYAWCHGRALWIMGLEISQWLEDMRGAAADGQAGVVRYVARALGEDCAAMLALAVHHRKPMPVPVVRGAWALEHVADRELREECWSLVRGRDPDEPLDELVARCERLVARVAALIGDAPNPLTPEGYHPALALARDWLRLVDAVGEEGFLPRDWVGRSGENA